MFGWLHSLSNDAGFMPHADPFPWTPALLWLYLIAHGVIAAACFSMPAALWYWARRRVDLAYRRHLFLFGVFIAACGITLSIRAWNIWHHAYWLEASLALLTGLLAVLCTVALRSIIPAALARSDASAELAQLRREVERLSRELEVRVDERTRELEASNRELARAMVVREYTQQELEASNERLNHYLHELKRQNEDSTRLNLLSDQLHCCDSQPELVKVLERSCSELFHSDGGALLEWRGEQLSLVGLPWGIGIDHDWHFADGALLALRRGELLPSHGAQLPITAERQLFCVPLQTRGSRTGALALVRSTPFWSGDSIVDDALERTCRAFADHTALALNNLGLREQLREQSLSDPLTGLYNRRYMYEQMDHLIALWGRNDEPFALILIDVDHFKMFNDRFGHDVGDEVLIHLADMLRHQVRRSDVACRMGGEEFVVLMAGAEQKQALARAEAIRSAVNQLRIDSAAASPLTVSAGVALFPAHGDDAFTLLRAADRALYESKREGRDRITLAQRDSESA